MDRFFAIVNPAAGGGRSAKLAGPALARLREKGLKVDVIASTCPGHAVQLAREAYDQGYRRFLAVGGDGTAHEILNGVFAGRAAVQRIALGFLPLGTRYSFNLLSVGFTADVAALTNRMFKPFGDLGYLLGVFVRVVQLRRRSVALRCDDDAEWDEGRSLFLTFNNSKYTGGTMLIAPHADPTDGLIEFVRWGPIGRLGLLRPLPRLYAGSHIEHPLAPRRPVRHVEFKVADPPDLLID